MASTIATVGFDGELVLPPEVQRTLGIAPGSLVEIIVRGHHVEIMPQQRASGRRESGMKAARELRGMFAGQPSVEDEYFRDRDHDKW